MSAEAPQPHRRHRRRGRGPRRLHVQIYLALVLALAVAAVVSALFSRWAFDRDGLPPFVDAVAAQLVRDLPAEGPLLAPALERRARELGASLVLWDEQGRELARGGPPARLQLPRGRGEASWSGDSGRAGFVTRLPDGRWLGAAVPHAQLHGGGAPWPLFALAGFLGLALVTWPISRRITSRLERLSLSVQRFGEGELSARAQIEGRDEVARLATRWNEAATRIEALVAQQRRVLASASHELRAPLARLRMAYELLLEQRGAQAEPQRARLLSQVSADIEELDALVGEVLLDARAQDPTLSRSFEPVDLAALVREQCELHGVTAHLPGGQPAPLVQGERRLLARLLRNLIENAQSHGGGQVEVALAVEERELVLRVLDRGPGVPEADRARIFEPFFRPAGHRETRDGGVGLGLSLVADVAHGHGGSVSHLPRDGGGSVLEVRLPLYTT